MTCPEPFVVEEGVCRYTLSARVFDEAGHEVENDYEGRNGCPHEESTTMKGESKLEQGFPTLGHSEPTMPDITSFIPKDGAISGMTVVLVGLVLASGLALKLVPTWLDHRLKKAQTDSKKPDCLPRYLALEEQAKLTARLLGDAEKRATVLEARVSVLEQKEESHDP